MFLNEYREKVLLRSGTAVDVSFSWNVFDRQKENSGTVDGQHQLPNMDHNSEYTQMSKLLHL